MSESTGPVLQNGAADTELELSAEDLLALSTHTTKSDAALTSAQSMPTRRYPAGTRIALSLVGAFVLMSAGYGLIAWYKATPSLADTFEQKTSLRELLSEAASPAEAEPVRLTNPFDAKEVFEFSPGTTQDAAREAVAEILMQRAMSRQGG
jgi:hypothetical protein